MTPKTLAESLLYPSSTKFKSLHQVTLQNTRGIKVRTRLLTLVLSCLIVGQAQATGLRLGLPEYGGSGCPAGTASAILSPAEDTVSVLFDSYIAEAGGETGRRVDRKSCAIGIPVQVPQGYSVAIFAVDYRGANIIPRGGMNRFNVEYFWAGVRGPTISRTFTGPTNKDFTVTDNLIASTLIWAPCGQSVTLRINSSMMSQSNRYNEQSMGIVDSADVSSGLIYHIQWRRCN